MARGCSRARSRRSDFLSARKNVASIAKNPASKLKRSDGVKWYLYGIFAVSFGSAGNAVDRSVDTAAAGGVRRACGRGIMHGECIYIASAVYAAYYCPRCEEYERMCGWRLQQ